MSQQNRPSFVASVHHPESEGIERGDRLPPDEGYYVHPIADISSAIAHGGHLFPLDADYCVIAKEMTLPDVGGPPPAILRVIWVSDVYRYFFCTDTTTFSLRYEHELPDWEDAVNLILNTALHVLGVPLARWSVQYVEYDAELEHIDCDRMDELLATPGFLDELEFETYTPAMLKIEDSEE